jgi:Na+-driven multidrug efflux pump
MVLIGLGLLLVGLGVFLLAGGLAGFFSGPEDFFDIGNSMAIVFSLPFLLVGSVVVLIGVVRTVHHSEGEGARSYVREDE